MKDRGITGETSLILLYEMGSEAFMLQLTSDKMANISVIRGMKTDSVAVDTKAFFLE